MPCPNLKASIFFARYPRERLLHGVIDAYTRAGWQARIIPRLEAEDEYCGCYEKFVDALLAEGEQERARQWCLEGYTRMGKEAPGIADRLQQRLREIAQKSRRHDLAAAYRAQDFFRHPSRKNL